MSLRPSGPAASDPLGRRGRRVLTLLLVPLALTGALVTAPAPATAAGAPGRPVLAPGAAEDRAAAASTRSGGATSEAGSYVVRARGDLPAVLAAARAAGGAVRRTVPLFETAVVDLPAGAAAGLRSRPEVASVTPNAPVRLASTSEAAPAPADSEYDPTKDPNSLYNVQSVVGARSLWSSGAGAGIDVALIDSGVAAVPGLSDSGKVVHGPDLSFESQDPARRNRDTFGHGTHLAGIIAGKDTGAVVDPSYDPRKSFLGVAPNARIVSVRVAGANGATDVSQVIAGIAWVVEHAKDPGLNIRVLNLAFGTTPRRATGPTPSRTPRRSPGAGASSWSLRRATAGALPGA